jgi:catalase
MMQGFGVHTFRLVNAGAVARFVKFHWRRARHALAGVGRGGQDLAAPIRLHRRDLWDAIEAGDYPEWELGLQVFTEEQAERSASTCSTRPSSSPRSWCR